MRPGKLRGSLGIQAHCARGSQWCGLDQRESRVYPPDSYQLRARAQDNGEVSCGDGVFRVNGGLPEASKLSRDAIGSCKKQHGKPPFEWCYLLRNTLFRFTMATLWPQLNSFLGTELIDW